MVPPKCCAMAIDKNQAPITMATRRAGAKRVTMDKPTGEIQRCPAVCKKKPRKRNSIATLPSGAAIEAPKTKAPKPIPRLNRPTAKYMMVLVSRWRRGKDSHREEKIGASMMMKRGLTD